MLAIKERVIRALCPRQDVPHRTTLAMLENIVEEKKGPRNRKCQSPPYTPSEKQGGFLLPAQNVAWGIVDRGNRKRLKVSRFFRAFDTIETATEV